ncbi:MAG: hypothetical protein IPK00_23600 [Deltaproteobacteria bacterium]|nr:hypothetical protein [Deltaproteobacteria bacterium]
MAGGVALLTVPLTLARWWLSQDAVEHLAIAQAWVHGAGFVDPVKWILPAGGPSPTPALALRAPAISLLAAIPLGLGASLTTTGVLHAVWASGVAGLVVPAARRCGMRGPAAFAAALLLATSPAWLALARHVWTEATALLAFLAVLATARGTVTSARGSLLCAVTTFLASLCRPNLIALALAVLVAGAAQSGVQRAARVRGLAIYALALAGFVFAYRACVVHAIGEAPYARYQTLFQVETTAEVWQYARADHGVLAYVASHGDLLATRAARTFADLVRVLFLEPTYHGIGWLALPGFAFALRSGERALERRFLALSGLGLAFVALLYVDFDRARFPLFTAAAASLSGFAWLDARAQALERGLSVRHGIAARALGWAPLVLACGPLAISLPGSLRHAAEGIAFYREQGTQERLWPELDVRMRPLCCAFAPGERIASVDPWTTHLWCGHATTMLPSDLAEPGVLEVFLAQEQPDWLIAAAEEPALRRSPRLRLRHRRDGLVLYQVEAPPGPGRSRARAWNAPPPLACAGRVERCAEAIDARARPRPRPARPARATSDFR